MISIPRSVKQLFDSTTINEKILHQEYTKYIETAYPSNHTYSISNKNLIPKRKLAARYKKINKLFPDPLTSIASIGSSKGFFIFSGTQYPHCVRGLGIDINPYDINICRWVKEKIGNENARFEKLMLHELAENIQEFGGPFQTVLVINLYQYLYFGSSSFSNCYLDHNFVFKNLRKICSERVIFNNRVNLRDCQNTQCIEQADPLSRQNYNEEKIRETASQYFTIKERGTIGKYPLWLLEIK